MNFLKSIFLVVLFTALMGCKNDKTEDSNPALGNDTVSTFYFIRHAEKDKSDTKNPDPELNQEGLGRSMFWAKVFEPIALDAIYSTDYERTKMTAAPTSVQKAIKVQYYDPRNINALDFLTENLGKKVLIVGHSNTTPDFVNLVLGEKKYSQMDESDNGSLYTVTIIGNTATSTVLNIDISTD